MAAVLGQWQIIGIRAEHDPSCNGDCARCPIPVQVEFSPDEVAAALTQAGFGDVAAAKAEALREAADEIRSDRGALDRFGSHFIGLLERRAARIARTDPS